MQTALECLQRSSVLVCHNCKHLKTLLLPFIRTLPLIALKCWDFPRHKHILMHPLPRIHDTPTQFHRIVVTLFQHLVAPYAHTVVWFSEHISAEICDMMFSYSVYFEMMLIIFSFHFFYCGFHLLCSQLFWWQGRCGTSLVLLNATRASSTIFFCLEWPVL